MPVAGVISAARHRTFISEQTLYAGIAPVAREAWEARTRPVGRTNAILAARAVRALCLALGSVERCITHLASLTLKGRIALAYAELSASSPS